MKHKKTVLLILIILAVILLIYFLHFMQKTEPGLLELYGNIEIRQADLAFRVEGRLLKLLKEEGDYVKKGELLAILDDISYRARWEKSLADIKQFRAKALEATKTYERNITLCADSTVSKEMCDKLLRDKNTANAVLESEIKQNEIYLDDFNNTKIYAPNDGIITTRIVEEGTIVGPSAPVYTLSVSKPVWVRTYVGEKNLANIKYGKKAKVITDTPDLKTGKNKEYIGTIGYISPVAEFTPKTVQTTEIRTDLVYRIRIYINDTDEYLRQGMPVTVKINLLEEENDGNNRN